MSLSRILIFLVGVVLCLFGVYLILQHYNEIYSLLVGLVLVVVGAYLLVGGKLTL